MGTDIKITKKVGVKNQDTPITADASNINFKGAGVNATVVGDEVTVVITGGGGGGGGSTNLSYIPAVNNGTVTSSTGTNATIPLADTTNAGLFSATEKAKLGIALVAVGVDYRGAYNNGDGTYGIGTVVLYNNELYEKISNPGNPGYPPSGPDWQLFEPLIGSPAFDLWIDNILQNKVNTIAGKGLSTEDYTTAEQTKLAGIAPGAEVNVNADWNATTGDAQILNKPTIPAAQVNADWLATSGLAQILNKPTSIPTNNVAHSVKYAVALTIGQAVYVSSADGTNMIVSKADYSAESTSSKTMGLVTATGGVNYQGEVLTEGLLAGLNTNAANAGDPVWLGDDGNLLYGVANKPVAPNHMVFIGIVTRANASNGEIFVKVQNGYELEELHNVLINGTLANNDILTYESSTLLWKNKTIAAALGYTPANKAGDTFTGAIAATNLSGTNTGDNAVNTLYSGLAASKQDVITLTTTGTSGAATLIGSTLNVPQYSGGGSVPQSITNASLIFYANNC